MINAAVRNSIRGSGRQAYPHQVARALPRTGLLLYLGRPNLEAADAPIGDDTEIGDDTIIRWMFLLPADADIRAATGWVSGVGNIFYDAAGDPVAVFASDIADWADINRYNVLFHLVSADTETGRLAIYALDADHATLNKARRVLREDQYDYWAPLGAILHYDAEVAPLTELAGGVHTLDHSVLGPQYQRLADVSYINVGAQPAVDVLAGGIKGLRSCGAIQNLAGLSLIKDASTTLVDGWYDISGCADGIDTIIARYNGSVGADATKPFTGYWLAEFNPSDVGKKIRYRIKRFSGTYVETAAEHTIVSGVNVFSALTFTQAADGYGASLVITRETDVGYATKVKPVGWIITQSSYPVLYVPPGVTQPTTSGTASNGTWFPINPGSPLYEALTGSPFTLATRIPMGVGSADLPNSSVLNICTPDDVSGRFLTVQKSSVGALTANLNDGTNNATVTLAAWSRGAILDFFPQVVGTNQMRVGYKVSTDASITWGSAATYDGSFGPDAVLSRFMLGYLNQYPMWLNKITAWKRQVPTTELEAWA